MWQGFLPEKEPLFTFRQTKVPCEGPYLNVGSNTLFKAKTFNLDVSVTTANIVTYDVMSCHVLQHWHLYDLEEITAADAIHTSCSLDDVVQ